MSLFRKKETVKEPVESMDLDAVMKKFDRESNTRVWEGVPKTVVTAVLALFSLFCIYVTLFTAWDTLERLTSFMAFIMIIGFLVFPAKKGMQRVNYMPWYDYVLMAVGSATFLYFFIAADHIRQQGLVIQTYEMILGILGILVVFELCRRAVGLPILFVAGAFIVYTLFFYPGAGRNFLSHLSLTTYNLFYTTNGILTTPVDVCSKFIVVFIIFGAFLERTGIADFFIQISNAFVGGFSGGPAKVAVVASALEGTVSGSSVANTVGSGSVTIPLMKRTGYKPEFAAAAEAAASTGGQIMPPIMGAAAFLMAEYLIGSLPGGYTDVVVRAILPAILYFAGVFITVHLEAKKEGLRGLTREELPKLKPLLKRSYLMFPLLLLIYLVASNAFTIQYSAAISIVAVIVVGLFNKENRITPKRIWEALAAGGQGMITVAAACAVAGIISGCITMTGLAQVLMNGIVSLAGNNHFIALFLTMLCCIVLGMGVPTTANYCIMATTCAPILIGMGIHPVAAHFFVFYFGIVADLTPPVALAAYAGAAIAQANPMKTALTSTKLAIAAFIVPYVFALSPEMLFVGETTVWSVILICLSAIVGISAVSAALEGYLLCKMHWYERILSAAGGLLLIVPGLLTDSIGLGLVAVVVLLQFVEKQKAGKRFA
ncbi:MAG: TRAP transporter permease [Clostridia bacterium]|nr:TRAP transporter permease [Clostridia bacterium]